MYIRSRQKWGVGVRETQKIVGLKSSSTVSWHFEKLEKAGIIKKDDANVYFLTEKGMEFQDLRIPTMISAYFIRGRLVSKYLILLTFLILSFVYIIIIWIFSGNHNFVVINSLICLLISILLISDEWIKFRKEFKKYYR
ncbi:MAG: hypothetical protein ACXAD7_08895 [Candidatus Kariarchaeaceae archaeon]